MKDSKILRIDLTEKSITTEDAEKYEKRFIGGRGVGSWILLNEMKPGVSATDPESIVTINTSALTGMFPSSGRTSISNKNTMTGGVNWTNVGGSFDSELRKTGWHHIVITGRSEEPVYLSIMDDEVKIKSAAHLWGMDVWDTENILKDEMADDKVQTLGIGIAGEKEVPMAILVTNRNRAAGGGGAGCIFGSKNLKAIAVRGTKTLSALHQAKFDEISKATKEKLANSQFTGFLQELDCFGTHLGPANNGCIYPYRNTQDDHYENVDESTVGLEKWLALRTDELKPSCFNCPIGCNSHILEADSGPFKGLQHRVPPNNTFYAYASRCDMRNPSNILKAYELLGRYGLDQDAVAVVISWAFECFEHGLLTRKETDWLDLTWGNDLAVLALIHKIARKEGFGALLAQGCKKAAETIGKGSELYCTHMKGQDNLDAVRALKAWGFGNVVSLRGGRHLDGAPTTELFPEIPPEMGQQLFGINTAFNPQTYDGKGKLVAWTSRFKAAVDSTGICYFATWWGSPEHCGPEDLAAAVSAATGTEISGERFMTIGERIVNVEKAFNTIHSGFTRKDDYPPPIYMQEPVKTGQYTGAILNQKDFDQTLDEFYEDHGWDKETSWQPEDLLQALEIPEVAALLKACDRLPDGWGSKS